MNLYFNSIAVIYLLDIVFVYSPVYCQESIGIYDLESQHESSELFEQQESPKRLQQKSVPISKKKLFLKEELTVSKSEIKLIDLLKNCERYIECKKRGFETVFRFDTSLKKKRLHINYLKNVISSILSSSFELVGSSVVLERPKLSLNEVDLESIVEKSLVTRKNHSNCLPKVKEIKKTIHKVIYADSAIPKIVSHSMKNLERNLNNRRFKLKIKFGDKISTTIPISVILGYECKSWIANTFIEKSQKITSNDLKLSFLNVDKPIAFVPLEKMLGRVAKRDIDAFAIINLRDLKKEILVKVRREAMLEITNRGISINVKVFPLENGGMNDQVLVEVKDSKKRLKAKVVGIDSLSLQVDSGIKVSKADNRFTEDSTLGM